MSKDPNKPIEAQEVTENELEGVVGGTASQPCGDQSTWFHPSKADKEGSGQPFGNLTWAS